MITGAQIKVCVCVCVCVCNKELEKERWRDRLCIAKRDKDLNLCDVHFHKLSTMFEFSCDKFQIFSMKRFYFTKITLFL